MTIDLGSLIMAAIGLLGGMAGVVKLIVHDEIAKLDDRYQLKVVADKDQEEIDRRLTKLEKTC